MIHSQVKDLIKERVSVGQPWIVKCHWCLLHSPPSLHAVWSGTWLWKEIKWSLINSFIQLTLIELLLRCRRRARLRRHGGEETDMVLPYWQLRCSQGDRNKGGTNEENTIATDYNIRVGCSPHSPLELSLKILIPILIELYLLNFGIHIWHQTDPSLLDNLSHF